LTETHLQVVTAGLSVEHVPGVWPNRATDFEGCYIMIMYYVVMAVGCIKTIKHLSFEQLSLSDLTSSVAIE